MRLLDVNNNSFKGMGYTIEVDKLIQKMRYFFSEEYQQLVEVDRIEKIQKSTKMYFTLYNDTLCTSEMYSGHYTYTRVQSYSLHKSNWLVYENVPNFIEDIRHNYKKDIKRMNDYKKHWESKRKKIDEVKKVIEGLKADMPEEFI